METDHTLLLIDYENVGNIDLNSIPPGVRVPFFFGASQKKVSTEFLKAAHRLANRFVPIDVEGQGKNSLDFHIAFYLGEYLAQSPKLQCVILSKDKGFDPLVKHLTNRGLRVRRVADMGEAFVAAETTKSAQEPEQLSQTYDAALIQLAAMPKVKRPRKRKGLIAYLHTHFAKKIPVEHLQLIVDRFIAENKMSETGGTLVYHM
jgi:hypothetical protein